ILAIAPFSPNLTKSRCSQVKRGLIVSQAVFNFPGEKPFLPKACLRLQILQTAIALDRGFEPIADLTVSRDDFSVLQEKKCPASLSNPISD
ncbi:hypothetical protein, partial [uncultured Nostoc sp.]|uniref:hypothetical protein n=1 Tax=uncultured Nostoc sp. TaxID=340711 RepID=UPI00261DF0D0